MPRQIIHNEAAFVGACNSFCEAVSAAVANAKPMPRGKCDRCGSHGVLETAKDGSESICRDCLTAHFAAQMEAV